ncbi:beta-ketoacyl synthase chain length factor [Reichenbachiella agariperforans]|uniref:beta-ketoacyl synthase chain length factor n=1 Tax=Reichenbachiella agariperforans TaxID=156994 RepID=UPI001C082966|nr:beta-ketoacyl synthase chain length factor [Reichenbachiella agariperforans]MBU2912517.1 beta-ketoacyl synthase chain length factor [Reichenbachiella agariperforans]
MYIKAATAISPQHTVDGSLFTEGVTAWTGNKCYAAEPSYIEMIPRALLRRMNKAVRMGVGAGLMTLQGQGTQDGIVLGTANGGIDDSFKFLRQILEYDEGTLTPTNFVQSTPNAVAGSLAMMTKNTGYNITHVNYGLAFEAALLDAMMLFEEGQVKSLLLGGLEEISDHNFNMDLQAGWFKTDEVNDTELFVSQTAGTVKGEGATMFVIDDDPEHALAQVLAVDQMNFATQLSLQDRAAQILDGHAISKEEVALMVGMNGDARHDGWYYDFQDAFNCQAVYSFKNLVGEYPTATAFAVWLATELFAREEVPQEIVLRGNHTLPKYLLIYNHYKAKQHSLILLRNPRV